MDYLFTNTVPKQLNTMLIIIKQNELNSFVISNLLYIYIFPLNCVEFILIIKFKTFEFGYALLRRFLQNFSRNIKHDDVIRHDFVVSTRLIGL